MDWSWLSSSTIDSAARPFCWVELPRARLLGAKQKTRQDFPGGPGAVSRDGSVATQIVSVH
jgi:hypothetical protein